MAGPARAQMPVTVAPQLLAPYSLSLSDYYLGESPRLIVTLINNDFSRPGLRVRLRMTLTGRNSRITLKTREGTAAAPIVLDGGIPAQLTLSDLQPYFNPDHLDFAGLSRADYARTGTLPEDVYDFCFEAVEQFSGQVLSRSSCATAFITLADPPLLNTPRRNSIVGLTEPFNHMFGWTPRHRPSLSTQYTFQIVELWDPNINPQSAFDSRPPLYEAQTTTTSILYGPSQPLLLPGKRYVWRIKANANNGLFGRSPFRNSGYSEAYVFSTDQVCPSVTNVIAGVLGPDLSLRWAPVAGVNAYSVEYRQLGNSAAPWLVQTATGTSVTISGLQQNATYEYRIGLPCGTNQLLAYSEPQTVLIPTDNRVKGTVDWVWRASAEGNGTGSGYGLVNNNARELTVARDEGPAGTTRRSLGGATVQAKLYSPMGGLIKEMTATTDSNGRYILPIKLADFRIMGAGMFMRQSKLSITVSYPYHAKAVTRTITASDLGSDFSAGATTLLMNSMDFYPYLRASVAVTNPLVEVFIPNEAYQTLPWLRRAGIVETSTRINYNGQNYYRIGYRSTSQPISTLPTLSTGNYLVRVKQPQGEPIFQALNDQIDSIPAQRYWVNYPDKALRLYRVYDYGSARRVSGRISIGGVAEQGINVIVSDQSSTGQAAQGAEYYATSDRNGNYVLALPPPRSAAGETKISVRDDRHRFNDLNTPPQTLAFTNGAAVANINLDLSQVTIAGRVKDQSNRHIGNALVEIQAASSPGGPVATIATVRTTPEGLYVAKVPLASASALIKVSYDEYAPAQQTITLPLTLRGGTTALNAASWAAALSAAPSVLAAGPGPTTADRLRVGAGPLAGAFPGFMPATETMRAVVDAGAAEVQVLQGVAKIKLVFPAGSGSGKVVFADGTQQTVANQGYFVYGFAPGTQAFTVSPVEGGAVFAPLQGSVLIVAGDTARLTVQLVPTVSVRGTVRGPDGAVLSGAAVSVVDLPYATTTASDGTYTLAVPQGVEMTLRASAAGFNARDSAFTFRAAATVNFRLRVRPAGTPAITTLSGYGVTITTLAAGDVAGTYKITGSLQVPANGVFAPRPGADRLHFTNLPVRVNTGTNAVPLQDINFDEAVFNVKAFTYANVELSSTTHLQLKPMRTSTGSISTSYETGGVVASKLKLLLADRAATRLPVNLGDAVLTMNGNTDAFTYVFAPASASALPALQSTAKFKTHFGDANVGTTTAATAYMSYVLGNIIPFSIAKDSGVLSSTGLSLAGYIKLPDAPGLLNKVSEGKVRIQNFTLGTNWAVSQFSVAITPDKPLQISIQRITARLTSLTLDGIGSANFGVGIGGTLLLKAPTPNEDNDIINIKSLKFMRKVGGISIDGKLALPNPGIRIKGLSFTMEDDRELTMAFDFGARSFAFKGSGTLNYESTPSAEGAGDGASKGTSSLFPIEIEQFTFKTADWSFLVAASANATLDLKVARIHLSRFIVAVGTNLDKDKLNGFLNGETGTLESEATEPNQPLNESTTSWAIGINGGLDFDQKGMNIEVSTSLLISHINNKTELTVNEIALGITQPNFSMKAVVKLALAGDSTGFSGEGTLTAMDYGLKAAFVYYHYKANPAANRLEGIRVAASVNITANFVTGPVQWFGIHGGFDFNTSSKVYMVNFGGDLGVVGTTRDVAYLRYVDIQVLFDMQACQKPYPIITGRATLNVLDEDWLTVTLKMDFCRHLTLATLDGEVPLVPGVKTSLKGVIFGLAPTTVNSSDGAFFLGLGASVSILDDMLKGNAFIGLGINYNNTHRYAPTEARAFWSSIDDAAKDGDKFHAVNIKGSLNIEEQTGEYDLKYLSVKYASASYTFNAGGDVNLYFKYTSKNLLLKASAAASLDASASLFSASVTGSASASISLTGGCISEKWFAKGVANARVKLYTDSKLSCNKVDFYTWKFKFCTDLLAAFTYNQGKVPKISVSIN